MNLAFLGILFTVLLFLSILGMIETGRRIGRKRFESEGESAGKGFTAVEGAIFGLLGLVLAFSFSGALTRFDARRQLVIKEANDIGTAWMRIDLLPPDVQAPMRELFRKYLDARLEAYSNASHREMVKSALERAAGIQKEIWALAVESRRPGGGAEAAGGGSLVSGMQAQMLLLPALNAMFDTGTSQQETVRFHPPTIIFIMLGSLILACALFAGYDMGGRRNVNLLHSVGFALVLSVTMYVIIDVEYPRLGFIRMSDSDDVLRNIRKGMD